MDSVWIKVALAAVVVVGGFIGVMMFLPDNSKSASPAHQVEKQKTFYDVVEEDKKRLEPPPAPNPDESATPADSTQPTRAPQPPATTAAQQTTAANPAAATQTQTAQAKPELKFRPLTVAEDVEASQIYEWIKTKRSMARLPVIGYNEMTEKCRLLMQRYPGSRWDYQARVVLNDIPERYWKQCHITEAERDTSMFLVKPDQK